MQQVSPTPTYPSYSVALADLIYHIVASPSAILASATLWNTLATFAQRAPHPSQLDEFLTRLRNRLTDSQRPNRVPEVKFEGQGATRTLANIQGAREQQPPDERSAAPESLTPYGQIVAQIDLAREMVSRMGGW
jgi:hypothetical protein